MKSSRFDMLCSRRWRLARSAYYLLTRLGSQGVAVFAFQLQLYIYFMNYIRSFVRRPSIRHLYDFKNDHIQYTAASADYPCHHIVHVNAPGV